MHNTARLGATLHKSASMSSESNAVGMRQGWSTYLISIFMTNEVNLPLPLVANFFKCFGYEEPRAPQFGIVRPRNASRRVCMVSRRWLGPLWALRFPGHECCRVSPQMCVAEWDSTVYGPIANWRRGATTPAVAQTFP